MNGMSVGELRIILEKMNPNALVMFNWDDNKSVKSVTEVIETVHSNELPTKTKYKLILKS